MKTYMPKEGAMRHCLTNALPTLFLMSFGLYQCNDLANDLAPDLQKAEMTVDHQQPMSTVEMIPIFPSDPADFVTGIANPYLAFETGRKFHYAGETDEGTETIVVEVTSETKEIIGVTTTVVRDQVFLDGELIEDTFDWFAEDKYGNVWYFGEDSKEIEDGEVVSTEGSWIAGVDGAMPGLLMAATPRNGMKYQQEFAEGVAEDMAMVINTNTSVQVGDMLYEGVLKTMEFTPLEPGQRENKYYAPGIGLVLEMSHAGGLQRIELITVE